jgi:hypothetical protein
MSARSGRPGMASPRSPGPRSGSSRRPRQWKPRMNREADSSPSREPGGTLSSLPAIVRGQRRPRQPQHQVPARPSAGPASWSHEIPPSASATGHS